MPRQHVADDDIFRILLECDVREPYDVQSKFDEEYISKGDASEAEQYHEVNSEENNIAIEKFDENHDEDEFIVKSGRKCHSSVPPLVTRRCQCKIISN